MGKGMEVPLRFCPFSLASLVIVRMATGALIIFALLLPANAQFWGDSWGRPQEQGQRHPYGGYESDRQWGFWGDRQWESPRYPRQREPERQRTSEAERDQPPDYSHAPQATPRNDAAIKIVVMGQEAALFRRAEPVGRSVAASVASQ